MRLAELEELLAPYPTLTRRGGGKHFRKRVEAVARAAAEQHRGDLLEIGARVGLTTIRLAKIAREHRRRVLVVDPWKQGTQDCAGWEYDEFVRRMEPWADVLDVVRQRSDHPEALKVMKRDLCFALVDGLHTDKAALADMRACRHAWVVCVDDIIGPESVMGAFVQGTGKGLWTARRRWDREGYILRRDTRE